MVQVEGFERRFLNSKAINQLHHLAAHHEAMFKHIPATGVWCTGFEVYHSLIKRLTHQSFIFKSIPKPLCNPPMDGLSVNMDRYGVIMDLMLIQSV